MATWQLGFCGYLMGIAALVHVTSTISLHGHYFFILLKPVILKKKKHLEAFKVATETSNY